MKRLAALFCAFVLAACGGSGERSVEAACAAGRTMSSQLDPALGEAAGVTWPQLIESAQTFAARVPEELMDSANVMLDALERIRDLATGDRSDQEKFTQDLIAIVETDEYKAADAELRAFLTDECGISDDESATPTGGSSETVTENG